MQPSYGLKTLHHKQGNLQLVFNQMIVKTEITDIT